MSKTIDLTQLTAEQLKAEIKRRDSVKQEDRKAYKILVNEELPNSIALLQHASAKLAETKTTVFENLLTLIDMKQKAYGVKSGQQSHTFSLDNGDTLTVGYRIVDGWDDTVNEGISKVNEFLGSLAKDHDSEMLVKTLNRLLKKDAKGNLKGSRVIELQQVAEEWNNEMFTDGVDIISKAFKPVKSVYFVEATIVKDDGTKEGVPLSISSVSFTKELEIKF